MLTSSRACEISFLSLRNIESFSAKFLSERLLQKASAFVSCLLVWIQAVFGMTFIIHHYPIKCLFRDHGYVVRVQLL